MARHLARPPWKLAERDAFRRLPAAVRLLEIGAGRGHDPDERFQSLTVRRPATG